MKRLLISLAAFLLFVCAPLAVSAQTVVQTSGNNGVGGTVVQTSGNAGGLQNPLSFSTIPQFLTAILGLMITVGSIVIVIMLVYVGFLFVTAQGAEEKIKEARHALLWTVIGALILLGAQAISTGIQATVSALGSGSTTTTTQSTTFP
jgi:heme/copper-type cytochrome/quinol oxidase subunit 2